MTPSGHDGSHVIQPNLIRGKTLRELSTGDPEDDQLLRQIAAGADLDRPREVRHYLYVPDEQSAHMIAGPLAATGCQAEILAPMMLVNPSA
jgi:Regulator of ribonuclease activity B